MKRDILFRAKCTEDGEWVYGVPSGKYMICNLDIIRHDDDMSASEYPEIDYVEIIPETVGQFTGLTDKNGVRIFEGDIVIGRSGYCGNPDIPMMEKKFVVKYWRGCFDELYCTDYYDFEVIGNVCDNPELMKGVNR